MHRKKFRRRTKNMKIYKKEQCSGVKVILSFTRKGLSLMGYFFPRKDYIFKNE